MTPASALAQGRVLVMRHRDADEALATALRTELVGALARVGLDLQLAPEVPPAPSTEARSGALVAARRAFQELRPEEAARACETLIRSGDEDGGLGLTPQEWIDVYLVLALARAALGDEAGADDAVERALAISPELAPAPEAWAPPLRERVARRRQARTEELAPLSVTTQPLGASVSIDGVETSAAFPLPLPRGAHRVRVEAPGYRALSALVDLRPDAPVELTASLELEPAYWLHHAGAPEGELDPRVVRAASSLDLQLVVVDLSRTAEGLRARVVAGELSASSSVPSGAGAAELADELASAWAGARALQSAAQTPELPPRGATDPAPWIVLGVGIAAAIGVAVGLGVGLGSQGPTGFSLRGELP